MWEMYEVLTRMHAHGIDNVRGWMFTAKYISMADKLLAFRLVCEVKDFCRKCGRAGHFIAECEHQSTDLWANGINITTDAVDDTEHSIAENVRQIAEVKQIAAVEKAEYERRIAEVERIAAVEKAEVERIAAVERVNNKRRIDELEYANASANEEINIQYKSAWERFIKSLNETRALNEDFQRRIAETKHEYERRMERENLDHKRRIADMERENEDHKRRIADMERDNATAKEDYERRIADMEREKADHQRRIAAIARMIGE
jgi:hypothetical protein